MSRKTKVKPPVCFATVSNEEWHADFKLVPKADLWLARLSFRRLSENVLREARAKARVLIYHPSTKSVETRNVTASFSPEIGMLVK